MLAFYINGYVYVRRICEKYQVSDTEVTSEWIPYSGIRVETILVPTNDGHIRKHFVHSEIKCIAYDCGFAVEIDVKGEKLTEEESMAQVENEYSMCRVTSLQGKGKGTIIDADPNTNFTSSNDKNPCSMLSYREREK